MDALFKNARGSIQPFAYPLKGGGQPGPNTRVFFQGEFKMEFPQVDMEDFVSTLLDHYNQLEDDAASENDGFKAEVLVLHQEPADEEGFQALLKHLATLKVKVHTLKDATGQGDIQAWIRETASHCQVVLPLVSADFFSEDNPCLPLMEELAAKNNPRNKFLVMPIVLKPVSLDGTAMGGLKTLRPLNKQTVYGDGQENKHFADIADTLKKYIETLA
ncbi:MAG: hypothetical protein IPL65_07580 [Lewinellaceae bacterium]|nr:hypothetical protein [Lewinellaceae bacterium]